MEAPFGGLERLNVALKLQVTNFESAQPVTD